MNEIDVLNKALEEYEHARKLKKINQELYDHLTGSIFYLLKYSEKYGIPLQKKDELIRLIETSDFYIDQFAKPKVTKNGLKSDQSLSDGFTQGEQPDEDSPEPFHRARFEQIASPQNEIKAL